ncbi:MAG: heme ABC transporter ATP-binding protein [Algiphilus sp.]|uniref:heme ABC transporter ATP-binding protein n=1 Tax=Algiphilus sp. TaxID=1872431 RepID=UPI0032EAAE18
MDGTPHRGFASDTLTAKAHPLMVCAGLNLKAGSKPLLADVSLRVRTGECLMLLGPNGAGKSTVLRVLAGELAPDAGQVHILGRSLEQWPGRALAQHRAVLPQQCAVHFPVTAGEVVDLGLPNTLRGQARDAIRSELMEWLAVGPLARRLYPSLSGGEQQRVQLARVLGQIWTTPGPRLLLLDECTSALDPAQQHAVMGMLRNLSRAAEIGIVATAHDLGLAATYADRVCLMRDGRVLEDAAPRQALTPERLAEVYDLRAQVRWEPVPSVEVEGTLNPRSAIPPASLATGQRAAA